MQRRSRTGTSHPGTSHPALQAAISPARLWDMIESQQGIITSQENVISNQRGLLRAQQATITSLQAIGAQQRRQIDKQEVDAVQAKKREQHQLTALKELESIRDAQKDELAARIEEVKKLRTELRAQSTNSLSTTGQAAKEQVQTPNELKYHATNTSTRNRMVKQKDHVRQQKSGQTKSSIRSYLTSARTIWLLSYWLP
ncbi:hypothetical protein GGR54DRAFT_613060 [Hypoxylon sp. NC1633]|nr:hypothetical protein GGR54DRAFT_613060 [Hypoxylon sp. NC1633]